MCVPFELRGDICRELSVVGGIFCVCTGVAAFFCCTGGNVETGAAAGREVGLGTDVAGVTGVGDIA